MSEFFENDAGRYQEAMDSSIAFAGVEHDLFLAAKAQKILDLAVGLGAASDLAVLDVGCGNGKLDLHLQPQVRELHGVDVADQMVAEARAINPAGIYASFDGHKLPYDDETFDIVFAVCVLHHVTPAARAALISEMARVTRIGGMTMIAEHNPFNPLTRLIVVRCEFDDETVLLLHARETRRLLRDAGLDRVRSDYVLFLPTLASAWLKVERRLAWLPLGAQYVAVGTRPH